MLNIITQGQEFMIDGNVVWHAGNLDPYCSNMSANISAAAAVYFEATSQSGQYFTQTRNTMVYETVKSDTHNAYNTTSGEYVVPVPGHYLINAIVGFDVCSYEFLINAFIYVNGVEVLQTFFPYGEITNAWLHSGALQGVIYCNGGDIIEVKYWVSVDQYTYPVESLNRISILKIKE